MKLGRMGWVFLKDMPRKWGFCQDATQKNQSEFFVFASSWQAWGRGHGKERFACEPWGGHRGFPQTWAPLRHLVCRLPRGHSGGSLPETWLGKHHARAESCHGFRHIGGRTLSRVWNSNDRHGLSFSLNAGDCSWLAWAQWLQRHFSIFFFAGFLYFACLFCSVSVPQLEMFIKNYVSRSSLLFSER